MPLDLEPIRARLGHINQERWAANIKPALDPRFPVGSFIAHAPADITALLDEVESLRSELERERRRVRELEQSLAEASERRWSLTP
jgi:hypothetical protein